MNRDLVTLKLLKGTTFFLKRTKFNPCSAYHDRVKLQWLAIFKSYEPVMNIPPSPREMKRIALSEVKDRLSEYLDMAKKEEIIITRHGKPAVC